MYNSFKKAGYTKPNQGSNVQAFKKLVGSVEADLKNCFSEKQNIILYVHYKLSYLVKGLFIEIRVF